MVAVAATEHDLRRPMGGLHRICRDREEIQSRCSQASKPPHFTGTAITVHVQMPGHLRTRSSPRTFKDMEGFESCLATLIKSIGKKIIIYVGKRRRGRGQASTRLHVG